jgi:hypothetical protein
VFQRYHLLHSHTRYPNTSCLCTLASNLQVHTFYVPIGITGTRLGSAINWRARRSSNPINQGEVCPHTGSLACLSGCPRVTPQTHQVACSLIFFFASPLSGQLDWSSQDDVDCVSQPLFVPLSGEPPLAFSPGCHGVKQLLCSEMIGRRPRRGVFLAARISKLHMSRL